MNEIEVRRVRNALARVGDAAPALRPEELAEIAENARSEPVAVERRRRPWAAIALAAVAAGAVGAGAMAVRDGGRRSDTTAGATLVSFPEGSAVYLLTSTAEANRNR